MELANRKRWLLWGVGMVAAIGIAWVAYAQWPRKPPTIEDDAETIAIALFTGNTRELSQHIIEHERVVFGWGPADIEKFFDAFLANHRTGEYVRTIHKYPVEQYASWVEIEIKLPDGRLQNVALRAIQTDQGGKALMSELLTRIWMTEAMASPTRGANMMRETRLRLVRDYEQLKALGWVEFVYPNPYQMPTSLDSAYRGAQEWLAQNPSE